MLEVVGGKGAILRIQAGTPSAANAAHYARIVEEHALLRRLIGVAGEISEMGYEMPDDVTVTLDRAETLVFDVAQRRLSTTLTPLYEAHPGEPRPARAALRERRHRSRGPVRLLRPRRPCSSGSRRRR